MFPKYYNVYFDVIIMVFNLSKVDGENVYFGHYVNNYNKFVSSYNIIF